MVCQALGYDAELAATVLMTAMHAGQLNCDTRVTRGGGNDVYVTTGLAPSEETVFDHDELLEFIASRLSPKRGDGEQQMPTRWPWGDYETKLLRELAAAADKFWKNYDPSDPTTAPKSEQVEAWLIERKVPSRTAQVVAKILRADGLRPGPRK